MKKLLRKKTHHYNTPGHAHLSRWQFFLRDELTFSCYRREKHLNDKTACQILLEEIEKSRKIYSFKLLSYVLMPNHVHLLIWPEMNSYDISKILGGIKGIMSKQYKTFLMENDEETYRKYCINKRGKQTFIYWQPGGGFDRNLWNAKAIHDSIKYIEANPVRSRLVEAPSEWKWSSAYARLHNEGVIPDTCNISVNLYNAQSQSVGKF